MNINFTPLCSVCCLSYKHSLFIEENIKSIWSQNYSNIEIIALDDGSPDDSYDLLDSLKKTSPIPMQIISQKNSGNIAKNLNKLLSKASGKYIIFIACDDKLAEDTIKSKIAMMEDDENLAFVASKKYYVIDNTDNIPKSLVLDHLDESIQSINDLIELEYNNLGTFYIQNAVFRKTLLDIIGGYDEDLLGDDIVIRTKLFLYMQKHRNLTFKFIDSFGFYYRLHDSNIHKNISRQIKLILQVMERYFPDRELPKMLKEWVCHGIGEMTFYETIKMFSINEQLLDLLLDKDIQKCFSKVYEIDTSLYKTTTIFSELLCDYGEGFIEAKSLTLPILKNNEYQEVLFDLAHELNVKRLQFRPLNRYCVIEIHQVILRNDEKSINLTQSISSNAIISRHPYYFFNTNTPEILFENLNTLKPKTLSIGFKMHHIGFKEVSNAIIDWQHNQIETIEKSKAWKIITLLRHPKFLLKTILIYSKFYLKKLHIALLVYFDKGKSYDDTFLQNQKNHERANDTLAIFSHFDRNNIIDDYVVHYLSEIKKLGADILFISTAEGLSDQELQKVSTLCKRVVVKQNIGYDFGAWRAGLSLVSETLNQYEQLILCNDSVYAPLFDLNEMFYQMKGKFDFWGITDNYHHGHHIQSYFMVFGKTVFLQKYFLDFWKNIRVFKHKESIIKNYEIGFTKLLRQHDHTAGVYCPSDPKSLKNTTHHEWKKLILEQHSPIIKIELLRDNPIKADIDDWEAFLKKHTSYNVELIKKHLARVKKTF